MKSNYIIKKKLIAIAVIILFTSELFAQTNPTAQNLPFTQNFGTTTFSSMPTGTAAWTVNSSPIGSQTNAQNSTANGNASVSTATSPQTTGGCYGYSTSSNGRFYIQTSSNSTNGTSQLACAINTTGWTNVLISYDVEMISATLRTVGVVLQYRIGTSGSWTNISGGVYSHNSSDRSNGSVDNYTSLSLPSGANNNSVVQLRWAIWRGSESGNSSGIAIDNISITATSNETAYYFRSKQNGDWNNASTWESSSDNSTWNNANIAPKYTANTITIQSGHTVSLIATDTIDQVIVDGKLIYADVSGSTPRINNGTGTDLIINGTFEDIGPNSIAWVSGATWSLGGSGTILRTRGTSSNNWRDKYNGGISNIPATANWILRKTSGDNPSLTSTGGMYYPNLIIENNTGSTWTTSSSSSFTGSSSSPIVKGNLDIGGSGTGNVSFLNDNTNASAVLVNGNLTVKTSSTLRNHGTGFEVQGDLVLNGAVDYTSGNASFILSGNNNQNISTTGTITFKNIQINKASTSATVTLQDPASITGIFTFTNGYLITTATNLITFNSGSSATGTSNNSFISGPVKKTGNTAFEFPTGKDNNYQPISISAPTNSSATYTAEYFHSDPALGYKKDLTIDFVSNCEYWKLNNIGTAYPVNVTLGWNANSCLIAADPTVMKLTRWDGLKWLDLGNSSVISGIVTSYDLTNDFGTFTLAQRADILCGFDSFIDGILADPISSANFDTIRQMIRDQVDFNNGRSVVQPNNYKIPVVFHIVGNGAAATILDAQITAQLQLLNDSYANLLGSTYGISDDAQIEFCLAQITPTGASWASFGSPTMNGVTRTATAGAITVSNNHNTDATGPNSQQALANIIYFNPQRYLNVWIVNSIGLNPPPSYINNVLGYSPFPILSGPPGQFLDGIVMRADVFGIGTSHPNYNQGGTLTHEAGHYLGLFHTFQFSCNEVVNVTPCNADGDECCDTPPVASANQFDCLLLTGVNSCTETPNFPDMYENHMDYAHDNINTCRNTFTDDQANRMHATIQLFRSTLVSFPNLLQTGVLCIPNTLDPTFVSSEPNGSVQFCSVNPYGFLAAPGAATYNWVFNGGTPATSTIQSPTGVVWNTPGVYNVTLTVTDGLGGNASYTAQVYVSNCTPIAGSNANWYFGRHAALNFSSGAPIAISPSAILTLESSATVSDNLGNLIFYTDGMIVYDNTHTAIPGVMNGAPNNSPLNQSSAAKGTVIVPRPGTNNFYIFTNSDAPTLGTQENGISLYEYNSGTNSLVSATPIHPTENYATTEPIVAIPHCNGLDYWIVVKPVNNSTLNGLINAGPLATVNDQIASYLVTNTGINGVPVLSNSTPFVPPTVWASPNNWIGHISVSPDKKIIAFTDTQGQNCYLYYFDCGNGTLEYITTLTGALYGISFSPNSEVLYTSQVAGKIRQYDLSTLSLCNPNPPFVEFDYIPAGTILPPGFLYSMQLGPDNKIYLARSGNPSINPQSIVAVINFPDVINTSSTSNECGYNFNGVYLLPNRYSRGDLPNDIDGFIGANNTAFSFCITSCVEACFTNLGCGTNFTWDFGDGNSITGNNGIIPPGTNGGTTSGNFEYPCHTYSGPGSYTVTFTIDGGTPIVQTVIISIPPVPTITGPNPVCSTSTIPESYFGPNGYNYSWTATNGTPNTGSLQPFNVDWTSFPATLTLVISDLATGCTNTNSITITQTSVPPIADAGTDVTLCVGQTTSLNGTGIGSYVWTPNVNLSCNTCPNPIASPTSLTTYTLSVTNGCGSSMDDVTIDVESCICAGILITNPTWATGFESTLSSGTLYALGYNTIVTGNVTLTNQAINIEPNISITVSAGAILTLDNSHLYSCTDMWQGIIIEPGGILNIINGSLIEDAIIAVDINNATSTTNILNVNGAIFNRNKTGINIINYTPSVAPYPFTVSDAVFTMRDFTFTNTTWPTTASFKTLMNSGSITEHYSIGDLPASSLKPNNTGSDYPITGIYLEDVGTGTYSDIVIGGNNTNATLNVFDNLGFGINALNSNLTSYNNAFQYIVTPTAPNPGGYAINALSTAGYFTDKRIQVMSDVTNSHGPNYFYDCSYAVNVDRYRDITINDCNIRSTAETTTPQLESGVVGIYVKTPNCTQITIDNNTITNMIVGIAFIGDNAGPVIVGGTPYSDAQDLGPVAITNNYINATLSSITPTDQVSYWGIVAENLMNYSGDPGVIHTVPNLAINNNHIHDLHNGIRMTNWLYILLTPTLGIGNKPISNNNFVSLRQIIYPNNTPQPQYGILHTLNWNTRIQNNNVQGFGNSFSSSFVDNWVGIASVNGIHFQEDEKVMCNYVANTGTGILFSGNFQQNTMFENNIMEGSGKGFVLDNCAIGDQDSPDYACMNMWPNASYSSGQFKTFTRNVTPGVTDPSFSTLYIDAATDPDQDPEFGGTSFNSNDLLVSSNTYSSSPANGLIQVTSNQNTTSCTVPSSIIDNTGGQLRSMTTWESQIYQLEQIVSDSISYNYFDDEQRIISKFHAYRLLNLQPLLKDSSIILQNFFNINQGGNIGNLSNAENAITGGELTLGESYINSVSPINNIEENYKNYYSIYLHYKNNSYTASDSAMLKGLANKCPVRDGMIVYQARSLFSLIYTDFTTYLDNCIDETSREKSLLENERNYSIQIYPNPNSGNFTIYFESGELVDKNVIIEVSDLTGKLQSSTTTQLKREITFLNAELSNGVYLISVKDINGLISQPKRITVIR